MSASASAPRAQRLAARLYAAHRSRLLAIAARNSADAQEAEEALQDAFALFLEHFDPRDEAPPLAWLTLTLKRRCWALYERRRGGSRLPAAPTEPHGGARAPEELCEGSEEVACLQRGLAALKPDERRALSLLALGYTYREIGELCGWTYTKVNRCVAEGRARLRELLR